MNENKNRDIQFFNDFWQFLKKNGNLKIIVGSQHLSRLERVAVGNWDVVSATKLISYLSKEYHESDIEFGEPIPYFDWSKKEEFTEKLMRGWSSTHLIILGSPDANIASAIVIETLFKSNGIKNKVIKERSDNDLSTLPSNLREYFDNETNRIHEHCILKETCKRQQSPNQKSVNQLFRDLTGYVCSKYDNNNNIEEEFVLGLCNWWDLRNKELLNYYGIGNLIIMDNPFCSMQIPDKCDCLKTDKRHKLILIGGLTGPTTLDSTLFLCGFNREKRFETIKKDFVDTINTSDCFSEYIFYTKVSEDKRIDSIQDERKASGIQDIINLRRNYEFSIQNNFISLGYDKPINEFEKNELLLNPNELTQLKELMRGNFVEDVLLDKVDKIQGLIDYYDKYKKEIDKHWEKSPYNKSVFIMMPFRENARYAAILRGIKKAAKDLNFKAYLAKEPDREKSTHIWPNIVTNMLSCKYGIAVQTLDEDRGKTSSPNVALELGFMSARGIENVLILKSEKDQLYSDLKGVLSKKFDIVNPENEVFNHVHRFLKEKSSEN